ncbi:hypothetical protein FD755_009154 [Muntiacus reevesi]|uniref:Glucose-6-phosphatase n=1 Tax=Muntiacus reevesi TaxID=9886 RepID=A0A5J5MMJ0_MUNRE|nr:hypothetical protein FD755_009154 [Muntiacus reevesi]
MDFFHRNGVLIIQHLQKDYRAYYNFLYFMSNVGDPRNIFSIYFPLWFQLNQTVGTKMILVAIYPNHSSPCLEQFPTTCETGPGSPSGHAMGSSCVWYIMVTAALSHTISQMDKSSITLHRLTWSFLWSLFWLIQISVCISRVFIAKYFPHQVILGVIGGVLVAEVSECTPGIRTASLSAYLKTNLFLFLLALGFYLLLRLLDIDLLNLGVLFGLGFAMHSEMFLRSCGGENGYRLSFRLLCALASLTTLQLYHFIKIPTDTKYLFYLLSFCKSASIPLTVVALIPYCIYMLMKPMQNSLIRIGWRVSACGPRVTLTHPHIGPTGQRETGGCQLEVTNGSHKTQSIHIYV